MSTSSLCLVVRLYTVASLRYSVTRIDGNQTSAAGSGGTVRADRSIVRCKLLSGLSCPLL